MYRCTNCGELFDEPMKTIEIHKEVPPPNVEVFYDCPRCGSSNYDEVVICDYCNEDLREDFKSVYVKFRNGDIICNSCLHDYCVEKYA